jgi:hypothetical protein
MLRITIAQFNYTIGDIEGTAQKMIDAAAQAAAQGDGSAAALIRALVAQAAAADDTKEGRYIAALNGHHQNSHEAFPLIAAACLAAVAGTAGGAITAVAGIGGAGNAFVRI